MINCDGGEGLSYKAARGIHFNRRILERYGHHLIPSVKQEIARMIAVAHDDVELVDDTLFPDVVFKVTFGVETYRIVYNMIDTTFVTALPIVEDVWFGKHSKKKINIYESQAYYVRSRKDDSLLYVKSKKEERISYYARKKHERFIKREHDLELTEY